jgi:hypothetical protein
MEDGPQQQTDGLATAKVDRVKEVADLKIDGVWRCPRTSV